MKNIIFFLFLISCYVHAHATFRQKINIVGNYTCKGYDPITKLRYSGLLKIQQRGQIFLLNWNYGQYLGTGLFNKYDARLLAANFTNPNDIKLHGIQTYYVKDDMNLVGNWIVLNNNFVGSELCVRMNKTS